MFLTDLKIGEAVKYENGIFAVALGGGTFDVNGNIIECNDGIRVVEVSDINKIFIFGSTTGETSTPKRKPKAEKVITHYINVDTKEETDIKKFQMVEKMFNNIHEKCFNSTRGMLEFKTMEDEYNYKLLENEVNKYKPVYSESSEVDETVVFEKSTGMKDKFQVNVIGYYNKPDTKYIDTSIRHGKAMYGKELGTYRFHASQYINDYVGYLAKNQNLDVVFPKNTDNVADIEINGQRLFSKTDAENLDFLLSPYTYHLDLDDAKEMLSFANKKIDFCIRMILSGALDKNERLTLINTLDDVIATLNKKRTTQNDSKHVLDIVENLKSTMVASAMHS